VQAKRAKHFDLADQIRAELRTKGIEPDTLRPPGYICPMDKETEKKLDLWAEAKRVRDFSTADAIRADLRTRGIEPDTMRPPGHLPQSQQPHQATQPFDTFTQQQLDSWVVAKRNKDFTTADSIRAKLRRKGIEPDEAWPVACDFQSALVQAGGSPNNNSSALAAATGLVAPLVDAISSTLLDRGLGAEHLQALVQEVTQQVMNLLAAQPHGLQPLQAPSTLAPQQGPASLPPRSFTSVPQKRNLGSSSKSQDYQTQSQLEQWAEAKRARDFKLADEIRAQLRLKGIDPDSPMPKRFRS